MSTRYILQYKYELIGDGEWIDEFNTDSPSAAQKKMANHIAEYEDMRCRIIRVKTTQTTEEVALFSPLQIYKETEE